MKKESTIKAKPHRAYLLTRKHLEGILNRRFACPAGRAWALHFVGHDGLKISTDPGQNLGLVCHMRNYQPKGYDEACSNVRWLVRSLTGDDIYTNGAHYDSSVDMWLQQGLAWIADHFLTAQGK